MALSFALAMVLAQPAAASAHDVELSGDGIVYSSGSRLTLFQGISLAVPGDSQTESFWIRNAGGSAGFLRVVVTELVSNDPALASALTVRASTDTAAGDPVTLNSASPCWVLVEGDRVNPGDSVKVTAVLSLGNLDGTLGQNGNASFSVRASISDAAVGSLPPTSCGRATASPPDSGPPAAIAMTGSDLPYPLLITGAGALGVGLFLLMAARRRRQEDA